MGRPVDESGGRCAGRAAPDASVPSPAVGRCVGRMVVGASPVATGLGATGLGWATGVDRTLRGASGATSDGAGTAAGAGAGAGAELSVATSRLGAGAASAGAAAGAFVERDDFAFAGSSGACSRRKPSASTLRRMRSAWASSMEADGLDAPMPSVWAIPSSSLLVRPSSFESSWTRIFF